MNAVARAREIVQRYEHMDVPDRQDSERDDEWSLPRWLRETWFPRLAESVGTDRHLGRAWEIREGMVRVAIEGERGRGFATVRLDEAGAITGLQLSDREIEDGAPIRKFYIACPGDRWPELDAFYRNALGFDVCRDGDSEYHAPGPQSPRQMHFDFFVPDAAAAEERVLAHGATRLDDDHAFADPVGHPFCLCADANRSGLGRVVLDCPDPAAMASFYGQLLRMPVRVDDRPDRIVIARDADTLPMPAFQRVANYVPPKWQDPARPQQMHFDLIFDDRDTAEQMAVQLGAIRMPPPGFGHVYADPAGHPFCLCEPGD